MAFLGNQPAAQFTTIPTVQRFNGTGSATEFTLDRAVTSVQSIMVSVDGVIQDTSSYTIPDGVTLTFSSAPSSGTGNIFINYLGLVLGTVTHPSTSSLNATSGTFSNNVTVAGTSTLSTINSSGDITATNSSGNRTVGIISGASNSSVLNMGDTDAANVGQVKYHHGVNSMVLRTNSADKITLDSTGNMLFNVANTGVYLGVTSGNSANLLNDYETGSWTPTLSSTSATFSYSFNSGHYVKVGDIVSCWARITSNATPSGTTSNALFIAGLPFTIYNHSDLYSGDSLGHFISYNIPSGYTSAAIQYQQSSATVILVNTGDNAGESAGTASAVSSSTQFRFRLTYRTA